MQHIYLKDYLNFSKEEKVALFLFLKKIEPRTVTRQKVVFGENALLLGFPDDIDIQNAKERIEDFFAPQRRVTLDIVKHIKNEKDYQVLEFEKRKIRIL